MSSSASSRASSPAATSSHPPMSPEETQTLVISLKRRADALEKELEEANGKKKKRYSASPMTRARGLLKLVSMHPIHEILAEVDRREMAKLEEEDSDDEEDDLTPEQLEEQQITKRHQDRLWIAYHALLKLIPGCQKVLATEADGDQERFIRGLERAANLARGEDISRSKSKVANILNRCEPPPMPLLDPISRNNRGFQHDSTGHRLCPIEYDFDDVDVKAKIRNNDPAFPTNGSLFFNGLYHGLRGDPLDVEKGFLKSGELLAKCLLTSSGSAEGYDIDAENQIPAAKKSKAPTKRNVAQILGITTVTPPIIAYVACMYHFSLTDATSWDANYNGFNYVALYDTIVDYFEAVKPETPEAKHMQELLGWWTKHLFPQQQSAAAAARSAVTFHSTISQQRAAKVKAAVDAEAAKRAAAAAATAAAVVISPASGSSN
ncbi:hypothetical protein BT96DRAFT_1021043 [Gymnopus androsaceus JB14]|uniref:Uncharacterized protein n=1 Tax=Gymnopus androsaceus JB14 TaxID=1447944 RepID=A0A6A4HJG1_9AGAR|nr:hypothetical protein BT96DRAFT_1021043 [Gymnopus androsaceus JB14]